MFEIQLLSVKTTPKGIPFGEHYMLYFVIFRQLTVRKFLIFRTLVDPLHILAQSYRPKLYKSVSFSYSKAVTGNEV
jgi:hypothetical protein